MMVMARDTDYPGLLEQVRGRRVLIWTCSTCARLCNGLGGQDAADRLAEALRGDGVDVVGTACVSASCITSKVEKNMPEGDYDTVVSLTCDMGASCAGDVSGMPVLNPVITFGPGYRASDGTVRLRSLVCGNVVKDEPVEDVAERTGAVAGPYV